MFKDNYNKAMDNICLDEGIIQKVTEQLNDGDFKTPRKKIAKRISFRVATAVVACVAVFVSVWAIHSNKNSDITPDIVSTESYTEIYKVVNDLLPKYSDYAEGDIWTDDEYEYYEEIITNDTDQEVLEEDLPDMEVPESPTDVTVNKKPITNDSEESHSETTTQVAGVDESDMVKTDGKYIYSLSFDSGKLRIIKAGKDAELISSITIDKFNFYNTGDMYLVGDKIVILGSKYAMLSNKETTVVHIYDVSNKETPKRVYVCEQSGYYNNSRLIGDKLYLISDYCVERNNLKKEKPASYIPSVKCENFNSTIKAEDIIVNNNCTEAMYTVICGYSVTDGSLISTKTFLGGIYTLYSSTQNIILAEYSKKGTTAILRYSIDDGQIEFKAKGEIKGSLLNQFSIDEYGDNFRFVSTYYKEMKNEAGVIYKSVTCNLLSVLDENLKLIGKIDDIAPDERIYSARFMGTTAYFVTFKETDPLFSVDLSDPKNPKIIGALKIPGFSSYLFPYGEGKLLGFGMDADEKNGETGELKLSMFDISDPADVKETAKKLIGNSYYSEALYDHKGILVNYNKNLIAFSAEGYDETYYMIYGFGDGEFKLKSKTKIDQFSFGVRGLYINDEFYIVTEDTVFVFDLNTFIEIKRINLE